MNTDGCPCTANPRDEKKQLLGCMMHSVFYLGKKTNYGLCSMEMPPW